MACCTSLSVSSMLCTDNKGPIRKIFYSSAISAFLDCHDLCTPRTRCMVGIAMQL